jgi:hypothetical protein
MTMNFQIVRDALITLLGSEAAGRYRTIGYQKRAQSADEVKDLNKSVQVFYRDGDFPKSGGSTDGPTKHDMLFRLELTVSKAAIGPLSVLDNPASTAPELAAAIAGFQDASYLADQSLDQMWDDIYQVLMDARNIDLGMNMYLGSRWVDSFRKDPPIERGELVVLTGNAQLTCTIDEQVGGDPGVVATDGIDLELEINEEPHRQAGVREEQIHVLDRASGDYVIDRNTGKLVIKR